MKKKNPEECLLTAQLVLRGLIPDFGHHPKTDPFYCEVETRAEASKRETHCGASGLSLKYIAFGLSSTTAITSTTTTTTADIFL